MRDGTRDDGANAGLRDDRQATAEQNDAVAHVLQPPTGLRGGDIEAGPVVGHFEADPVRVLVQDDQMFTEGPPCFDAFWIASRQQ